MVKEFLRCFLILIYSNSKTRGQLYTIIICHICKNLSDQQENGFKD